MPRMTKIEAQKVFTAARIKPDTDFFVLDPRKVALLNFAADERGYRQPRNANGSRARCFYAYMQRALRSAK